MQNMARTKVSCKVSRSSISARVTKTQRYKHATRLGIGMNNRNAIRRTGFLHLIYYAIRVMNKGRGNCSQSMQSIQSTSDRAQGRQNYQQPTRDQVKILERVHSSRHALPELLPRGLHMRAWVTTRIRVTSVLVRDRFRVTCRT